MILELVFQFQAIDLFSSSISFVKSCSLSEIFFHASEFKKIYDRLDVTVIERGESFYHKLMPKAVEDLEKADKYFG